MNILFIGHTRLGDAVISSGLLGHLSEVHPGARITVVCGSVPAPLLALAPGVERVIAMDKRSWRAHWLALWPQVAAERWDLVVDLRRSLVPWLLRARRRAVLPRGGAPAHRVVSMARTLDLEKTPPAPRLWTTQAQRDKAAGIIPAGPPVVGLGPTANWRGKIWPAPNFVGLVERLTGAGGIVPGARMAVFGAAGERAQAQMLLDAIEPARRIDLVGTVDLPTAFACLGRCSLYIGNDTGLMHMAAAACVPTLGLFGPSREQHYAPWGANTSCVRTAKSYDELVGAPGYDHRTTGTLMETLSVQLAAAGAAELWLRARGEAA